MATVLAVALGWPGVAVAEPKDPVARAHLQDGQAAVARDEYAAAVASYEQALAIEREPKVLYLLGQAEFLRGNCRESVRYFTQVREFEVGSEVAEAMRPYLAECAERLADEPDPPVPVPTSDEPIEPVESDEAASTADEPAVDEPAQARRWYQDPLGDVLGATGVAGIVAGGVLLVVARQRRTGAATYGTLEGDADGIRTFQIAGGASLGVGAALMIGGLVRWGLVSRKGKGGAARARVQPMYGPSVAGLSLSGRF